MTEVTTIKVHRIIQGPFHSWDVTDDEDGDYEGDFYFCLALTEVGGVLAEEEIRFDEFPDFAEVRDHLAKGIEPFVLEVEEF